MDESVDAFLGWVILGFGVLLGYATWKQVPGGAIGALKNAITTGQLVHGPSGNITDGGSDSGSGGGSVAAAGDLSAPSPIAAAAVNYAVAQVGKPYQWGATGPNSFDCSGLIYAAYRSAGLTIPRTTYTQIVGGKGVRASDIAPGDLLFPEPAHVWLYIGNGQAVEAPHTGTDVQIITVGHFIAARRYAPAVPVQANSPVNPGTTARSGGKPIPGL